MTVKLRGPLGVGVAGAAMVLLIVGLLIVPKAGAIQKKQKDVTQAQQLEAQLTIELEQLRAVAADADKNRARLATLEHAVPDLADLPGMIRLVNGAAADADVDFITVAPGSPTSPAGSKVSTVPTSITVLGRYFAVDEFLRKLENLSRISKVTNLTLNEGPKGYPQLQMSLNVEFYTTDASAGPDSQPGHQSALPVPVPSPSPTP
jgi:Tfp pilus assembly protein PilO